MIFIAHVPAARCGSNIGKCFFAIGLDLWWLSDRWRAFSHEVLGS